MTILCSPSGLSNYAEVSFQFHRCNRLTWHLHLLEPCGQGSLIRSFHNAYDLSLRQVQKTSIWLHRRIILGGFCDLVDLFPRKGTRRHGMAAHEFRHNIFYFIGLLFWSEKLCLRLGEFPESVKQVFVIALCSSPGRGVYLLLRG